jgi:hypothetical protein
VSEAEIHTGSNAVEDKLANIGFGKDRIDVREAAPDEGTPAETVQADEQPRDDAGRFASNDIPPDPPNPEGRPEPTDELVTDEPQAADDQDPAVAAFLKKYNGDVEKALQGAVHLQRKSGEQSNEVGELRRMVDELAQLREGMQQGQQQPQMDQGTIDWFDQQALENPYQAAEWARQQGNSMLQQRALSTWKEIDPGNYAVYLNNLQNQEFEQRLEKRLAQAQQLPMDASINVALTNVRSRNPQFSNYDDAIATAMEKYPSAARAVQVAAENGQAGELEAAIETLYGLAEGDTLRQIALTGPAPESTTTTNTVAAPTISEPHEAPAPPTPDSEFRDAFRQEAEQSRRGVFVAE